MRGRRLLALLSLLWLMVLSLPASGESLPAASAGRLVLPQMPQEPVALLGEWGFAWHQYLDPLWDALPTSAVAPVPSNWNDLHADGKPAGANGWGTYVLQVDCPLGESLALEAMGERTASRVFVNGVLVAHHGELGTSAADTHAAIYNRVPITHEFPCPLRITVHVANFEHRAGGFVRPMSVGTEEGLARQRESQVIQAAALLATYLLVGLVSLIFFAVRHRERVPLLFGLFCVAMAIYTDMIGERLLLHAFPPLIGWVPYMRAEYLSWIASMTLFFLTLRGLFPEEIGKRPVQAVAATLGVAAVAVVVLPPAIYSYVATPGQAIAVGVAVYIASAMVRARKRTPVDARVMLLGLLAVLVALAIDLFLIDAPGLDKKFAPIGFAVFMLSPAVVIARRLSQALNAEERSRTLEENAQLREDVERMSRHDLKTPLNSILGATRLLHDDPRLSTEQRELAAVLQHASRRMLEMVNLSLGLFKMETGSYDLRPQAVDLREVVTRVLVDLHSHAEAHGVTLHLQGSDRSRVAVRAEEALCYSIVANLVKNAIEAAGHGRHVTLVLERADPVVLTVQNPGEVPPEIAPRFFEKYVTSGKSGGTGLGTYSARLMARAQQGDLQMRTSPLDGTTLTLTLPAAGPDLRLPLREEEADDGLRKAIAALPTCHVLVVDDDEFTRLVTRRLLPAPPFVVDVAPNGLAAGEAMARHWPQYVLLDMEMPHRNGLDTVRWIREQEATQGRPRCRIVMLSGNDDPATPERALAAGADRFLAKPATRERLLGAMLELQADLPKQATAPAAPGDGTAEEILVVDPEWAEAFPGFLRGYRDTVEGMGRALAEGDREDLQFMAHRIAGGLSAMGLHWAAQQGRVLERDALDGAQAALAARIKALREHLARVRIEAA